jgi:hypothetical protein
MNDCADGFTIRLSIAAAWDTQSVVKSKPFADTRTLVDLEPLSDNGIPRSGRLSPNDHFVRKLLQNVHARNAENIGSFVEIYTR